MRTRRSKRPFSSRVAMSFEVAQTGQNQLTERANGGMDKGLPAILIRRARLADGEVAWEGRLPVVEAMGDDHLKMLGAPSAGLRITESNNGGIRVVGTIDSELELRCRRCLVQERRDRSLAIDIRLEPDVETCDEAPGVYALDERLESVDLWPALYEELVLSLPGYPVCSADCKGLCGVCGSDLNKGACGCAVSEADPRWDALRSMARADEEDD